MSLYVCTRKKIAIVSYFRLIYLSYLLSVPLVTEDHHTEKEGENSRERNIKTLEITIPVQITIDKCHPEETTMLIVTHMEHPERMRVLTITLLGKKVILMDHLQKGMNLIFTHFLLGTMENTKIRI